MIRNGYINNVAKFNYNENRFKKFIIQYYDDRSIIEKIIHDYNFDTGYEYYVNEYSDSYNEREKYLFDSEKLNTSPISGIKINRDIYEY